MLYFNFSSSATEDELNKAKISDYIYKTYIKKDYDNETIFDLINLSTEVERERGNIISGI